MPIPAWLLSKPETHLNDCAAMQTVVHLFRAGALAVEEFNGAVQEIRMLDENWPEEKAEGFGAPLVLTVDVKNGKIIPMEEEPVARCFFHRND